MPTFIVLGTGRQLGAIGLIEPFRYVVQADDAEEARQRTRRARSLSREHIRIRAAFEEIKSGDLQTFLAEAKPTSAAVATEALEQLRQISDALNVIDTKRCNEPCGRAEDQAEAELERRAGDICKVHGLGLIRQRDPRGRALAIATPRSGRYNGMGGAEAGWCI